MNLPEILSEGPKSYTELRGSTPTEVFDILIAKALKAREIVKVVNGSVKYGLPPKRPEDGPLRDPFKPHAFCIQCGEPVYRKKAKFCTRECMAKGKTTPKPACKRCGEPCKENKDKYCSPECRWNKE